MKLQACRAVKLAQMERMGNRLDHLRVSDELDTIDFNPAQICNVEPSMFGPNYCLVTMSSGVEYIVEGDIDLTGLG